MLSSASRNYLVETSIKSRRVTFRPEWTRDSSLSVCKIWMFNNPCDYETLLVVVVLLFRTANVLVHPLIIIRLIAVLVLFALAWNVNGQRRQEKQQQLERRPRQYQDGRRGVPRIKRMYALCPPQFERVGNECYYFSDSKVNWLDAQFQCQDKNSKLAEPSKVDDRRLRKHLLAAPGERR